MTRWRVSATTRLALAVAAGILLSSILLGTSVYYAVSTQLLQDARVLVRADMGALRDIYRRADVGLSGVNFAVAETGTLCLVENEGNG